jgi:hypothetical protein
MIRSRPRTPDTRRYEGRPPRDWQPDGPEWLPDEQQVAMDCRNRNQALVERLRAHHPERET